MIHLIYRDINIELSENGNYYEIYEYTPVTRQRCRIQGGAAPAGTYNLEYVKSEIDRLIP